MDGHSPVEDNSLARFKQAERFDLIDDAHLKENALHWALIEGYRSISNPHQTLSVNFKVLPARTPHSRVYRKLSTGESPHTADLHEIKWT